MPACAICGSVILVQSKVCPKNTEPESGRVFPVMTSCSVVLPAPLGPIMQRNSPTSMVRDKLFNALKPSKLTVISSKYNTTPCVVSNWSPKLTRPLESPLLALKSEMLLLIMFILNVSCRLLCWRYRFLFKP